MAKPDSSTHNEESGLILAIPEAEDLVGPFRLQWDPSAALGVPAHITLLFPFLPRVDIDARELNELQGLFSQFPGFQLTLDETRRWPDVLYLHPSPPEPVKDLMEQLFAAYPQLPPYGGQVDEPTPHLTVAQVEDSHALDEISLQFNREALSRLPINAQVREATLILREGPRWKSAHRFPLKK